MALPRIIVTGSTRGLGRAFAQEGRQHQREAVALRQPPQVVAETADAATVLRQLIESHLAYTGSAVAQRILDNWVAMLPKFKKVMPVDYRRALTEMQAEQEKALAAIRGEVVDLSLNAASQVLGRRVDSDDDRRLVQELVSQEGGA